MAKFKKKIAGGTPAISTASLPDIVFMLLFFFMVTTTIRDASLKVKVVTPNATEIQKLEKKTLVSYIYVGPPANASLKATFGTEPRIQLNDAYATIADIAEFVEQERDARDEAEKMKITTSLKIDKDTKMGLVTDIKQELRKQNALKINYSTKKGNLEASK
ncbi:MAG: biopolymer transporter ExbD [Bacteroidia bacterium]|nr:biopolymer transporter ExbD [Bacteroidota bacterium]MBK8873511.1 biopolymer transporter ExbD [Bacteroidota bacterium]MBK9047757.1 biopolymer transporter ExbD [Bacteroidota bacterium]MBP9083006.1 biopolymer transporter ExbD [Bacteroidia bacterium]